MQSGISNSSPQQIIHSGNAQRNFKVISAHWRHRLQHNRPRKRSHDMPLRKGSAASSLKAHSTAGRVHQVNDGEVFHDVRRRSKHLR